VSRLRQAVLVVLFSVAAACGDKSMVAVGDSGQRYEGSFIVLESEQHGPELCSAVKTSNPPQCDGYRWWAGIGTRSETSGP
jgi:hypothetical protein